jgi:predicted O-methyltransferase YrrM
MQINWTYYSLSNSHALLFALGLLILASLVLFIVKLAQAVGDPPAPIAISACKPNSSGLVERLRTAARTQLTSSELEIIDRCRTESEAVGALPLWGRYREVAEYPRDTVGSRLASQVSTPGPYGAFFVGLVEQIRPKTIVEFGSAFGISGMYFLTGLNRTDSGHLYSFEPNAAWAAIARDNFNAVSAAYCLTVGTFEDNIGVVPDEIDLAFVDAIHTGEFVEAQLATLLPRMAPNGIILFDDVNFSDDMRGCWQRISRDPRFAVSAVIGGRQGAIQL